MADGEEEKPNVMLQEVGPGAEPMCSTNADVQRAAEGEALVSGIAVAKKAQRELGEAQHTVERSVVVASKGGVAHACNGEDAIASGTVQFLSVAK